MKRSIAYLFLCAMLLAGCSPQGQPVPVDQPTPTVSFTPSPATTMNPIQQAMATQSAAKADLPTARAPACPREPGLL